jgi:hypothetical protein
MGYSLNPTYGYPNGHFTLTNKHVCIDYELTNDINLSNYKISVVFFGFNVL